MEAIEILESIKNNKNVSRWDCLRLKHELRELLENKKYRNLTIIVESLIESAKESL